MLRAFRIFILFQILETLLALEISATAVASRISYTLVRNPGEEVIGAEFLV